MHIGKQPAQFSGVSGFAHAFRHGLQMGMTARLRLEQVSKSVPGGRVLFHDLDLTVESGELVAILGESGSGKSTLLNIIAGLDSIDAGRVVIDGHPLEGLDDRALTALRRDHIGFVFQAFHILPYLTIARNVALPLALNQRRARSALSQAHAMLEAVGLGDRTDAYARDLSGGELQRVAIARALVHNPALILADEPTGNLDPETAAVIMDLFATATRERGAGGVLVTHSATAAAVADRILRLSPTGLVDG
jgi:putative ABC transport system ATP-binding protein